METHIVEYNAYAMTHFLFQMVCASGPNGEKWVGYVF